MLLARIGYVCICGGVQARGDSHDVLVRVWSCDCRVSTSVVNVLLFWPTCCTSRALPCWPALLHSRGWGLHAPGVSCCSRCTCGLPMFARVSLTLSCVCGGVGFCPRAFTTCMACMHVCNFVFRGFSASPSDPGSHMC